MTETALSALKRLAQKWREGLSDQNPGEREVYTAYRRGCADELDALLQSLPEAEGPVPEVTHYQGARIKCTPHMCPIIDLESHADDGFDYYLVRSEVKRASPLTKAETQEAVATNALINTLRWIYDRLDGAPEYTLTPQEQATTHAQIAAVLEGRESIAARYEAGEFDPSSKLNIAHPAPDSAGKQ